LIAPIESVGAALPTTLVAPTQAPAAPGFAELVEQSLDRVDGMVNNGDDALRALASGGDVDLHGAMIALEEADIALRAMVTVRDKVVGAYEQLMNLSI
jgi:flagellar hook-basal body complex protein FliE